MSKTLRVFLIACLALLPAVSYSQTTGACRIDYLQTQNSVGALVPVIGAKVRVCSYSDTTVPCTGLPIYSDPGLNSRIDNPIITDGRGRYAYCIVGGNYNEQISGSGIIGVNNQPVSIGGTGSGGGGTGSVLDGSNYKIPFYPAALAATLNPSNITSDATGNNLNVPGTLAVGGAMSTYRGTLQMPTFTANRTWTFPDKAGTVAMLSDVSGAALTPAGGSGDIQTNNGSGGLSSIPQSTFATPSWVTGQGYLTSSSLSGYATQPWVTSQSYVTSSALAGYATQAWVQAQNYGPGSGSVNPQTHVYFYEEFIGGGTASGQLGELGWRSNGGGGSVFRPTGEEVAGTTFYGILQVDSVTGWEYLIFGQDNYQQYLNPQGTFAMKTRVAVTNNLNGTHRAGFFVQDGVQDVTDGLYFEQSASGHWFAVSRASSTQTATDTGIAAVLNQWYTLEINGSGGTITYKIDGTTVATQTTNVPTSFLLWAYECAYTGSVQAYMDVDYAMLDMSVTR